MLYQPVIRDYSIYVFIIHNKITTKAVILQDTYLFKCTFRTSHRNIWHFTHSLLYRVPLAKFMLRHWLAFSKLDACIRLDSNFDFVSFSSSSLAKISLRPISTVQLHALLHFHLQPIYLVVFKGSYWLVSGISHLEGGFTLRCLQRLSLPDLATLLCTW